MLSPNPVLIFSALASCGLHLFAKVSHTHSLCFRCCFWPICSGTS